MLVRATPVAKLQRLPTLPESPDGAECRSGYYLAPNLQVKHMNTSWGNSSEAKYPAQMEVEQVKIARDVTLGTSVGFCSIDLARHLVPVSTPPS